MVVVTCVSGMSGVSGVLQCLDSRETLGSSFGYNYVVPTTKCMHVTFIVCKTLTNA